MEEELHALIVDGLLTRIDNSLQHQVRLLQLIPEEKIGLGEADLYGVVLLGEITTEHIETAEHPTTARRPLVGDRLFLRLHTEIGVEGTCILVVLRQRINTIGGNGIH